MKVKDLQEAVDDLKDQAAKRAADMLGERRTELRQAIGGHSDGTLFAMLVLGIALGAVAGAALALLFTPISGGEARRRLSEGVEKVRMGETVAGNGSPRHTTPAAVTPPYVAS